MSTILWATEDYSYQIQSQEGLFIPSQVLQVIELTPEENVKCFFKALVLLDSHCTLILTAVTEISVFY